jgi:hypothetical protein
VGSIPASRTIFFRTNGSEEILSHFSFQLQIPPPHGAATVELTVLHEHLSLLSAIAERSIKITLPLAVSAQDCLASFRRTGLTNSWQACQSFLFVNERKLSSPMTNGSFASPPGNKLTAGTLAGDAAHINEFA